MGETEEVLSRFHGILVDEIREQRPDYLSGPFTVAEIYQNLIPYGSHRDRIGVEMNGDYEDALLRLLAGEGGYLILESAPALQSLRQELESANPNTGLYREYAAADVRLNPDRLDSQAAAFEAGDDGATKRMYAQATGINAVWVIDWDTREVIDMLWPPELPLWEKNADGIQSGDMHGLEVLPDRSAVWASSRLDSRIYGWSLPDFEYIGSVKVGPSANWITSTPDSRYMYVAVSGSDHTLAVDLQSLEIVAKIKTGARPARISTVILPPDRVNPPGTNMRSKE